MQLNYLRSKASDAKADLKDQLSQLSSALDSSKSLMSGSIAHVAEGLRLESENLETATKNQVSESVLRLQSLTNDTNKIAQSLGPALDEVMAGLYISRCSSN